MELFGFLSVVGDVQEVQTQSGNGNSQYGSSPFVVRELSVATFVVGSENGELRPYLRQVPLRLTGRQAQNFSLAAGCYVAVEYGCSSRPYRGQDGKVHVAGNNTVSRICCVENTDFDLLQKVITV